MSRSNIHVLEDVLSSLSNCDQTNVVLNFEGLKHLDYRTVQRIVDQVIEFKCDGGDLKMAAASRYIKSILQAMGLEDEIYISVEEALLSFVGDILDEEPQ